MKRMVFVFIAVLVLCVSCSTTSPFMISSKKNVAAADKSLMENMPSWVISDPSDETYIYTYGYGKADTREAAMAYARSEAVSKLAEQVSLVIDRATEDTLTNTKEEQESSSARKLVDSTKTQSHAIVNGAKQTNLFLISETELYIQYGIKVDNLFNQITTLMSNLNEQLKASDSTYNISNFDNIDYAEKNNNKDFLSTFKESLAKLFSK